MGNCRLVHRRGDTIFCHGDNFTGQDVADKLRANRVKSGRFRSQHVARLRLAQTQRPIAEGIAHAVNRLSRAGHKRVGSFQHAHDFFDFLFDGGFPRPRDELHDDFGIHRRLEIGALQKELPTKRRRIDEIPIVRERQRAFLALHLERLDIARNG